ncbi:MAG: hypothetical protein JNL52_13495 [Flavobacteriales bacterium]|nr:hypothetical protein [Flavobacteriales bacterium]
MLDNLLPLLKEKVGADLMNKVGLDASKTDGALNAASSTVSELLGGKGIDMGTVLNLFSNSANTAGANDLLGQLGQNYLGKLTGQVGLDAAKANSVKDLVMPALTNLLSDKIGGNAGALQGLLGNLGSGGDIADMAKGMLGKLFK